jgi:hypothetical protein
MSTHLERKQTARVNAKRRRYANRLENQIERLKGNNEETEKYKKSLENALNILQAKHTVENINQQLVNK